MTRLLTVLLLLQAPIPKASLQGLVVRAGATPLLPLMNARLELSGGPQVLVARTDGIGRFAFPDLPPGQYRLQVTKDGYIRQEYGQRGPNTPGIPIAVRSGQQPRDLVFQLEAAPTLSGFVRDSEGDPIANIVVQALRTTYNLIGRREQTILASTRTDDRGEYRLYWLDPGEYFIGAGGLPLSGAPDLPQSGSPVSYAQTYFPGFADVDDAKAIRLEANREAGGFDFRLVRQVMSGVTGNTFNAITGRAVSAKVTLSPPADGAGAALYQAESNNRGEFALREVAPGSYIVSASAVSGERLTAVARIRVGDFDPRISLDLGPGIPLSGRMFSQTEAPADFETAKVQLSPLDSSLPSPPRVAVLADGRFSLPGIQPGTYVLSVSGLREDAYLKAARYGPADALEQPMQVRYGRDEISPPLEIALRTDGGRIGGTVVDGANLSFGGAQMTLVPEVGYRQRSEQYRIVTADEDGRFAIRGIPPGNYKLFAWEGIEPNAYLNPEYIRRYEDLGVAISVSPGENAPVSLRVIQAGP